MNAVSILLASLAHTPPPPKLAVAAVDTKLDTNLIGESPFLGQLKVAIEERKGQTKDPKPDTANKHTKGSVDKKEPETSQPQPLVALAAPPSPPAPPVPPPRGALGVPTPGVEPGSNPSGARAEPKTVSAPPMDTTALTTLAALPATPPELPGIEAAQAQPAEAAPPKAELAFALKLTDQPANTPRLLPLAATAPAGSSASPRSLAQPRSFATPKEMSAPVEPTESGSQPSAPKQTPRAGQPQPAPESKPARQPASATGAATAPAKDNQSEAPAATGPVLSATMPATRDMPEPAISAPAPSRVEPVSEAPAPAAPKAPVTEVSISVPLQRPDSSADERVAIRMVQKGEEIHVSVRTPDPQLTQSLRQDLGKLGSDLDQAGFRTESWRPLSVTSVAAPANSSLQHEPSQGGANQDLARQDGRSGGQADAGSEEQKQRQQGDRPRWVAELEQQTSS